MISRGRSIAILAGNPAFGGILQRALENAGGHKVAHFESIEALTTYLRIAPTDVVILDTEMSGSSAVDIARGLRGYMKLASPDFYIVALTRAPAPFHKPLLNACIDHVLTKPVTPAVLLAAVEALFESPRAVAATGTFPLTRPVRQFEERANPPVRVGNVIPLFGEGRERP